MTVNFWLYMIPTVLFVIAIYKQFGIVVVSPQGDPYIGFKVAFLIFNMCIVTGYWLMLYSLFQEALFFFIVPGAISAFTYLVNRKNDLLIKK
jgi:hypothetical protein